MLSIARVVRGRQGYYLATVPTGRDHDGGLVEPDGEWLGEGARLAGLTGTVEPAALGALLSGVHPATGEVLSPSHRRVQVAGFDCTFSPPKSVSVLHALGPQDAAAEVRASHEAAVRAAVGYLERTAGRARRAQRARPGAGSGGGRVTVATQGLAAAAFLHRASRAPDPHLHSHVLVANCAPGADGRWSALDGRALFVEAATAGHLYEAALRREIGARLGMRFGAMRGRLADLEGFDAHILKAFSRRSVEIEQHLAEFGFDGPRARRVAALATRPPKDLSVPYETLAEEWRRRAGSLGLPVGHLGRLVEAGRRRGAPADEGGRFPRDRGEIECLAETLAGPRGLTERAASFTRGQLIRAHCRAARAGMSTTQAEETADRVLASAFVVPREEAARVLRRSHRSGGGRFPAGVAELRYTTREVLEVEQALVERARRGAVEVLDLAHPRGAVPTDVLDAARAAWDASGVRVVGIAPALRSAHRLEAAAGIESVGMDVLGRDPASLRRGIAGLRAGVLVVSPAERVDPRRLHAVLDAAEAGGARVVFAAGRLDGPDAAPLSALARVGAMGREVLVSSPAPVGAPAPAASPSPAPVGAPAEVREPGRSGGAVVPEWGVTARAAEWVDVDGVSVGLVADAAAARQAALDAWRRRLAEGRAVILVAPDRMTAHAMKAVAVVPARTSGPAGPGPAGPTAAGPAAPGPRPDAAGPDAGSRSIVDLPEVVLPSGVAAALERRPDACLVTIGGAASLPSTVRRSAGVERVHVVVVASTDRVVREGRAAEAALPQRLVRTLGALPRTPEGRAAWRTAAALTVGDRAPARGRSVDGASVSSAPVHEHSVKLADRDRARQPAPAAERERATALAEALRTLDGIRRDRSRSRSRERGVGRSLGRG